MTKKRFTRHKSLDRDCTIYDELKDFQFPSLPLGVSEIFCDKLNELNNEVTAQKIVIEGYQERNEKLFNGNNQLKQFFNKCEDEMQYYRSKSASLEEGYLAYQNENEQLKQSVNNLKETIIKITIAYQRKYDRNIVDLVHEVHDEDITDLIKELSE